MRLFESTFRTDDYKNWCRYYDTETKQSEIYEILDENDLFAEDPHGGYTHIISKKKYRKISPRKQKQYRENESDGKCSAQLVHIRNNYWKFEGSNYNTNPSIFYLDIETTAHSPVDIVRCNERIVSIQIFHNLSNTNIILSTEDVEEPKSENGFYKFGSRVYDFKCKFIKCSSEAELLTKYFDCVKLLKPLLVIAHNGEGFDFKYLWSRTEKNGIQERFSPFGESSIKENKTPDGKLWYQLNAPGIHYIDNLVIYKKFRLAPRASYSLDYLAQVELNESKVPHSCYSTFDGFRTGEGYIKSSECPPQSSELEYELWNAQTDDIPKISRKWFLHYSIIDTWLLYKMDSKLKLSSILIGLASIMGVTIQQATGTVQPWANYIRNYCMQNGIIMPGYKQREDEPYVVGGFVKEPKPGKYNWVYVVDVTSMYPSQMMAFNMSPDTFVPHFKLPKDLTDEMEKVGLSVDEQFHLKEYFENKFKYANLTNILKKYNLCATLNGAFFDKSKKGVIPILVEHIFTQRKLAKKQMLEQEKLFEKTKLQKYADEAQRLNIHQNALKIAINGLYGALGNPAFDLFNEMIANGITANARFYVQLFSKNIEVLKGNKCLYNDTDAGDFAVPDSVSNAIQHLDLNGKIDYIDNYIETEIQPVINASSQELGNIFNALDASKISAKREVIAEKAIFIAKKRYIMKIWDSEGVRFSEPHLKMMGIDLVRSSTPEFSKKYLKEAVNILMDGNEQDVSNFISSVRTKFMNASLSSIAKVSSISKLNYKLGEKSIPINARAAMVSNDCIAKNFNGRFQQLVSGEKVKMLYLVKNNPLGSNIFAFNDENFALNFKQYVDWDTNFEKFFLSPLEIMTKPLGYNISKQSEDLDCW